MEKRKILIQFDTDSQPSVFDRVVAIDAGADEVFGYGGITPENVEPLVHGAIFTRGQKDLKSTALFVGGSDVAAGERVLRAVIGSMQPGSGHRVSVMLDSNGANTTAVAAVRAAANHLSFIAARALVLGGTGPVGQRVALLLARQGAEVRLASRQLARAQKAVEAVREKVPGAKLEPVAVAGPGDLPPALDGRNLVFAAGAAGVTLLPHTARLACSTLKVAIDLNAVSPLGIEGVELFDRGVERGGVICYGAIGVGPSKMKIHRGAVARLFQSNDQVLDAEEIYALAQTL
jgi:methylenetetrahydrofolate/methylenetetrahydromethanopterin dehydrogenase (NADP+)